MLRLSLRMLLRRGLGNHSSACVHSRGCVAVSRSHSIGRPLPFVHHSLWSLQQPPVAAPPAARVWVAARHRSGPSTDSMAENGNQAALKRQREPAEAEDAAAQDTKRGKRKRGKDSEQVRTLTWALQHACKLGAAKEALHIFNKLAAAHEAAGTPLEPGMYTVLLHVLNGGWKWELLARKAFLERQPGADAAALAAAARRFEQGVLQLAQEMHDAAAAEAQQAGTTVITQPQVAGDGRLLNEMPRGLFCHIDKPMDMSSGDMQQQRQSKGRPRFENGANKQQQGEQPAPADDAPTEQQQAAGSTAQLLVQLEGQAKKWDQQGPIVTAALEDLAPGPLTPAQQQEQVGRVVEGVLGLPPGRLDEGMYTQAARAAAIAGDAAQVSAIMRQFLGAWRASGGTNAKLTPRLRTFHPALLLAALQGEVEGAEALVAEVEGIGIEGLELTESEYALLLEAVSRGGTYAQATAQFSRLQSHATSLRPATLRLAADFFASDRAAAALAPGGEVAGGSAGGGEAGQQQQQQQGGWVMEQVEVADDGHCAAAGGQLKLFDLEDSEWQPFLESVKQLALKLQGKAGNFEHFMAWLERAAGKKQHTIAIDAANVSLYGENWEEGAFRFGKVINIYNALSEMYPKARVLVVLHQGRFMQHLKSQGPSRELEWAEALKVKGNLYLSHVGSNDDWYWLYAVVAAKGAGLLVSNDQLRDHVWNLLRAKHFLKWRERHIINFDFPRTPTMGYDFDSPLLLPPKPFTRCVQEVRPGVWMLPSSDGTWWCARPAAGHSAPPAAAGAGSGEEAAGAAAVEAAAA